MKKNILFFIFFGVVFFQRSSLEAIKLIRSFDLGGGGMKTALIQYDEESRKMNFIGDVFQFDKCPDDQEVADWLRERMREVAGIDLDQEASQGYLFGFSLAGLGNKLRVKPVGNYDVPILFNLPMPRVKVIDDGNAHLIASLVMHRDRFPDVVIWNFAIGSGIGFGCTRDGRKIIRRDALKLNFYQHSQWVETKCVGSGSLCPAKDDGFDAIVLANNGVVDEGCYKEFALRWSAFIKRNLESCDDLVQEPSPIVLTGGYMDFHAEGFMEALGELKILTTILVGPKNAGLLGAAWHVIHSDVF